MHNIHARCNLLTLKIPYGVPNLLVREADVRCACPCLRRSISTLEPLHFLSLRRRAFSISHHLAKEVVHCYLDILFTFVMMVIKA